MTIKAFQKMIMLIATLIIFPGMVIVMDWIFMEYERGEWMGLIFRMMSAFGMAGSLCLISVDLMKEFMAEKKRKECLKIQDKAPLTVAAVDTDQRGFERELITLNHK